MDKNQMRVIMAAQVSLVCEELTDLELAVLNNVVQLDGNPRGRLFDYEKVKGLFTERDGTKAHDEVKVALAAVVNSRLG